GPGDHRAPQRGAVPEARGPETGEGHRRETLRPAEGPDHSRRARTRPERPRQLSCGVWPDTGAGRKRGRAVRPPGLASMPTRYPSGGGVGREGGTLGGPRARHAVASQAGAADEVRDELMPALTRRLASPTEL